MKCDVLLPNWWVNARAFDDALAQSGGPHQNKFLDVSIQLPIGCKIMVDAAARLLSLLNQLASTPRRVFLEFNPDDDNAIGYLNRMGFFDYLDKAVVVIPERPAYSSAEIYGGTSSSLVEFVRLNPKNCEETLPGRLADILDQACHGRKDKGRLVGAAFTTFAELIGNVYQHSETDLDGYAALQVYRNSGTAKVVVSDSGKGIIDTLRPTLKDPKYRNLSNTDLVVEIFRQGLSRHGSIRGCGLKESASQAIKFKTILDVRLPNCSVHLVPSKDGYRTNTAYCNESLPLLWGTHICFDFKIDSGQ